MYQGGADSGLPPSTFSAAHPSPSLTLCTLLDSQVLSLSCVSPASLSRSFRDLTSDQLFDSLQWDYFHLYVISLLSNQMINSSMAVVVTIFLSFIFYG